MNESEREMETWLRRVKWALACLPDAERDDIVAEIREHLLERVAQGAQASAVLAEFGRPEGYARQFIDEREVSFAAGSRHNLPMLGVVVSRAHRSAVAAIALLATAGLATVAFVAVLTAIIKIFDPLHAGLWQGGKELFLGVVDNSGTSHELLGNWIYPLAALSIVVSWLSGRAILVWAVSRLARTS